MCVLPLSAGHVREEDTWPEVNALADRLVAAGDLQSLLEVFESVNPDINSMDDGDLQYIYDNYILER